MLCDLVYKKQSCMCRFVDPSDPSKLFLAQPTEAVSQRPEAPKYAANFGADEAYES